jgi:leucyl aminopeptidase
MLAFRFAPLPATTAVSTAETLVVFAGENSGTLPCPALPQAVADKLKTLLPQEEFKGKRGETAVFAGLEGLSARRVIVAGLGDVTKLDTLAWQEIGGKVYARLAALPSPEALVALPESHASASIAANLAYGALLRSYRFDKYKTKDRDKKPKLASLHITTADAAGAAAHFQTLHTLADAVFLARTLQNEPANVIYPASLAEAARDALTPHGVKVTILGEDAMRALGMHSLLGVGQGSARESQLVVMEYHGADDKTTAPLGFVGKGVTFDTGGISIKSAGGMEDMKWDMGGSAVVIATMLNLASRKAKVNAVGVVGLVENMPSSTAQRPGDIVTAMSGQTIEILNTDAEGRLVLADALWYCQKNISPAPRLIIDLATLTGAIVVALGDITAGLFSNADTLASQLEQASRTTGEALWRMPMGEAYDRLIDSDWADVKNIGDAGRLGPGSITAAHFLRRFIDGDLPWAHLDIAGVTWTKKDLPTVPKGCTGWGVRLLDAFVRENFEG